MATTRELELKAAEMRKATWEMIYRAKTGHTGSDLSCADILVALYNQVLKQTPATFTDPNRDRYIQSKGHAVEILYNVLADQGYFPKSDLLTYSQFNSPYIGHPTNHINGIELNTGSLGHGLGLSVGVALAGKLDHRDYHVYTLMGDGEQAEGSVWEAAMSAGNYKLDNLTAIIDHNRLQISGPTADVMNSEPLADKYRAFGFDVVEIDGNNMAELVSALSTTNTPERPKLILADTIKGKGISFAENQAAWHHKVPTAEQYQQGLDELNAVIGGLQNE
ncbi:transketolase [Lactobacillus selangorensis]|uniref:Transketolase n=1 Tax=Lactobacillus selangorensis TaxID=81857 RepID=A0A0R2FY18_9LACO|nr:transketolase [Lactobacillus selangorensis]KRN28574.1 transketolase [Lactobacillus selangorensis]KRN33016.1 transketolase [Lactobacillus selangorensis]